MFIMRIVLLLALLTVCQCVSNDVVGRTGHNITLQCKYDRQSRGELSICWNRGEISMSGCSNPLIATGTYKPKEETSDSGKYQLLGRLDEGDVSLTILNLTETDAGRYGCRVDIPGWFNDEKHHFDLKIEKASATTVSSENSTNVFTQPTAAARTPGQMTSTASVHTSSSNSSTDALRHESSPYLTTVLVSILFGLVALVTVVGITVMAKRWKQVVKVPQQVSGSVRFNSSSSTLQLHHQGSAVENIYQINGGGEGGEYEYCP